MATKPYPDAYKKDLYKVLQVNPQAIQEVIDAAHKALLKIHAPRAVDDDEKLAREIGEAHIILTRERSAYDAHRRSQVKSIGGYQIVSQIAEGGFGVTYKAKHSLLDEYSCIKHRDTSSATAQEIATAEEILRQETKTIWNLRHYGLPIMRDLVRLDDGSLALVMSWIEGPTLEQEVEKGGKLAPEEVAWRMERLLNTLMFLHDFGVLHGDIKPQNSIVQPDTRMVSLVDFGLSLVKPSSTSRSKGYTELFSPPEQILGKTLLPESDLYSLGMTMLYALNGSYVATERRDIPANVPDPFCDFIKSLIVQDVRHRPKSARKLFEQFSEIRQASFGRKHSGMPRVSKP